MKKRTKILLSTVIVLAVITGGVFLYSNYLLNKVQYENGDTGDGTEYFEQDENADNLEETDPNDIVWNEQAFKRHENDVINILLVGEEKIGDIVRGRPDSIMIATINVPEKAVKLTSIMRDLYVQIPGYSDNKLNAAFHIGGMELLMETLELNFDLQVDGYVKVDFDSFEQVIDKLGGVEITLNQREADYLNRTNYISKPSNRHVVAGTQVMNGNQALGYARIRYVSTGTEANDFGRTQRQRKLLTAIFDKYKSKSSLELLAMLPDLLSMVTTNLTKTQMIEDMYLVLTISPNTLETSRIPVDEKYQSARVRGMSVLIMDTQSENIAALHEFIFGDVSEQINTSKP